jgi:ribosomal protein L32
VEREAESSRDHQREYDGYRLRNAAARKDAVPTDDDVDLSPVAIGLALVGSACLIIGVFLPRVENTSAFAGIAENSLIQTGDGWWFIALAVGIAAAVYRAWRKGEKSWSVIVLAVLATAFALYLGVDEATRTLYPLDESGTADASAEGTVAAAGIGIYVVGVGGVLALLGGFQMQRDVERRSAGQPRVVAHATKSCPECAETVLDAARVCKHCGYRFEPVPATERPGAS